jgi:hypothetical protein
MTARRLTAKRVRELLDYDPKTGEFRWRPRPNNPAANARLAGKLAGHEADGYWRIRFDGHNHAAARLAWLWMKGWLPKGDVDHRDGNGLNNRWDNLRASTKAQNNQNLKRAPSSKGHPTGCTWLEHRQKWQVYIGVDGKRVFVGHFGTRDAAARAYLDAAAELHRDFSFTERPRLVFQNPHRVSRSGGPHERAPQSRPNRGDLAHSLNRRSFDQLALPLPPRSDWPSGEPLALS